MRTTQPDMHEIDFLPAEYRQLHARRRGQPWRIIVVAGTAAVMGLALFAQDWWRVSIQRRLDVIRPQYELAVAQSKQLSSLQSQLRAARADAELYTYLRHPWPRTRILEEIMRPLPDEVVFSRVTIGRENADKAPSLRRSRSEQQAEEAQAAALPPASRDLKRLRQEVDPVRTVVNLGGTTTDSAALHRYLGILAKTDLFSKVELTDVEGVEADSTGTLRFNAMLAVRPAFGQPGGPTGPDMGRATHIRGDHLTKADRKTIEPLQVQRP
jgi:Tfp pilus assembly protein PilN